MFVYIATISVDSVYVKAIHKSTKDFALCWSCFQTLHTVTSQKICGREIVPRPCTQVNFETRCEVSGDKTSTRHDIELAIVP